MATDKGCSDLLNSGVVLQSPGLLTSNNYNQREMTVTYQKVFLVLVISRKKGSFLFGIHVSSFSCSLHTKE